MTVESENWRTGESGYWIGRLNGDRSIVLSQLTNSMTRLLDSLCELSSGFQLSRGPVCELAGLEVHLDVAAVQMATDELF